MNITTLPENLDLDNAEFKTLWSLVSNTRQSIFLTGKAGTGKSTFLKYICANTKKKYVVLAPTGIAAVNVGGMTLHSFFKIPFKPLLPTDLEFSPLRIRKTLKYNKDKVKLLKELDLIIIDEISMVRADIIDFIDKVLRIYCGKMREPFGGKQLLFVGDIFQLEPVVTGDMKEILRHYYRQFFFFNASVFTQLDLVPIELKKIYRQNNAEFISILDAVRDNSISYQQLQKINSRYNTLTAADSNKEFVITLATRRDTVDSINDAHLKALTTPEFEFKGVIKDEFPETNLPTSKTLVLKVGAQVIFIKNDKDQRWVNGTIGKIINLDDGIMVELETGEIYKLDMELWENMRYSYDEKKKEIKEEVLGIFRQYPIKPAWALTVHKSQGLTFNKVIIDFGGGAFAGGQTYVALSRCTSLDGISLKSMISNRDIIVNPEVVRFSRSFNDSHLISHAIETAKADTYFRDASIAFDKLDLSCAVDNFLNGNKLKNVIDAPLTARIIRRKMQTFKKMNDEISALKLVIHEQNQKMRNLAQEYVQLGKDSLSYSTADVVEDSTENYSKNKYNSIAVKSAIANYNKALSIFPECADAYQGKGELYSSLGEYDEALAAFDKALSYNINDAMLYYLIGKTHMLCNDTASALKSYKKAIKADKNEPLFYNAIGDCYDKIGLEDLAVIAREKADKLRAKLLKKSSKKSKK